MLGGDLLRLVLVRAARQAEAVAPAGLSQFDFALLALGFGAAVGDVAVTVTIAGHWGCFLPATRRFLV